MVSWVQASSAPGIEEPESHSNRRALIMDCPRSEILVYSASLGLAPALCAMICVMRVLTLLIHPLSSRRGPPAYPPTSLPRDHLAIHIAGHRNSHRSEIARLDVLAAQMRHYRRASGCDHLQGRPRQVRRRSEECGPHLAEPVIDGAGFLPGQIPDRGCHRVGRTVADPVV